MERPLIGVEQATSLAGGPDFNKKCAKILVITGEQLIKIPASRELVILRPDNKNARNRKIPKTA